MTACVIQTALTASPVPWPQAGRPCTSHSPRAFPRVWLLLRSSGFFLLLFIIDGSEMAKSEEVFINKSRTAMSLCVGSALLCGLGVFLKQTVCVASGSSPSALPGQPVLGTELGGKQQQVAQTCVENFHYHRVSSRYLPHFSDEKIKVQEEVELGFRPQIS